MMSGAEKTTSPPYGSGNSFPCGQCSKVFNRKENLSRHVKNHTNSRSHQCEICCKAFTRSDLLKRHLRLHDKASGTQVTQPNKRRKGNDVTGISDDPNSADANGSTHLVSQTSIDQPASHSEVAVYSCHEPSPNDGHFDFNDIEQVDIWSNNGLFDLPFLQQFSSEFPPSWDDYLAFEFECWRNDHLSNQPRAGSETQGLGLPIEDSDRPSAAISRAPSPPNEASHEDQTPFAWSPSSKRIAEPSEVRLEPHDPLLKGINTHFELSEPSYQKLKFSITRAFRIDELQILTPLHSLPSRSVVNAFISRFAKCFLPQAPVIHVPTFDINDDLPDYLIAIMISIGATYCRRKNARRFAIVLQDWARCRLQLSIEADNTLLRSPITVYAAALICYAGIWCGNKRAYELAEAMRGSVVTWLRRLVGNGGHNVGREASEAGDVSEAWHAWAREDGTKRLQWMVYALDYQYASLTNMPSSMSLAEVQGWDCPGDREYWEAASAKQWKALLGRANVPPSREFALAVAPFVFAECPFSPLRSTNSWTAFLILLTINIQAIQEISRIHFLQHLSIMALDESQEIETAIVEDQEQQRKLYMALDLWQEYYGPRSTTQSSAQASSFFDVASQDLYQLCRLQLQVSVTDIQDILGKSGLSGVQRARSRFTRWLTKDEASFHQAASEAVFALERHYDVKVNTGKVDSNFSSAASAPYSSIYVFLAHAFLYACSTIANVEQKAHILGFILSRKHIDSSSPVFRLLDGAFGESAKTESDGRAVLRLGAELLARFENWACSLNLALLLHWRSKL